MAINRILSLFQTYNADLAEGPSQTHIIWIGEPLTVVQIYVLKFKSLSHTSVLETIIFLSFSPVFLFVKENFVTGQTYFDCDFMNGQSCSLGQALSNQDEGMSNQEKLWNSKCTYDSQKLLYSLPWFHLRPTFYLGKEHITSSSVYHSPHS